MPSQSKPLNTSETLANNQSSRNQENDDNGRNTLPASADLEAARDSVHHSGSGLDSIAILQNSDEYLYLAQELRQLCTYGNLIKQRHIMESCESLVKADASGDQELRFQMEKSLVQEIDQWVESLYYQRQVAAFPRPETGAVKQFRQAVDKALGTHIASQFGDDPKCYVSLGRVDKVGGMAREVLTTGFMSYLFRWCKTDKVIPNNTNYNTFLPIAERIIRVSLHIFINIMFMYIPVVFPPLGIISSHAGIAIFYAGYLAVSCVAANLLFELPIALVVQLAFVAMLGNVMFQHMGP